MQRQQPLSMIPPNPFDHRMRADPYPVYLFMRTVEPVHRSPVGYWILTRYADCKAVLDDKRWSHDADRILEPGRGELDPVDPTVRLLRASALFSDPPEHARHLRPLEKAMKASMVETEPRVQQVANGLIKLMHEKGTGLDLIHDFAAPLSLVVLADMIGVAASDRGNLQRWARGLAAGLDPTVRSTGVVNAGAAAAAFVEYLVDRIGARKSGPPGMLASLLDEPGRLTNWELIANLTTFLVIGIETTTNLIGNGMLALMRHPDQMKKLRENPAVIKTGLEELARFDGPIHLTARAADQNVEVGGTTIKAGEQAILLLAAANRDPARFKDPDRLDLARTPNPHLGYGGGVHACFAAPLARLIAGTAISTLAAKPKGIELSADPAWHNSVTVRGLSKLPVTLKK
ncbi:MAG TPA: cytochrome P450 [Candidatus Dormibacteraeota bacterium]